MKIVLIIYIISWLIILAIYISSKLLKVSIPNWDEPWKVFFFFLFLSPFIPLMMLSDYIKNKIKEKENAKMKQRQKEEKERRNKAYAQMYTITFKDIPFEPEKGQVIYVENYFDEKVNAFIKDNYDKLVEEFRKDDLEFVYLPMYFNASEQKEKMQYYAPYLTSQTSNHALNSYLLDFMLRPENRVTIPPSLLFCPNQRQNEWVFRAFSIDDMIENNSTISDIVLKVKDVSAIVFYPVGVIEFQRVSTHKKEEPTSGEVSEADAPYASQQDVVEDDSEKTRFRVVEETGDKESDEDSGIRFRKVVHDEDKDLLFRSADEEDCKDDSDTLFHVVTDPEKIEENKRRKEFYDAIPQIVEAEKMAENELDADTALEICEILFNLQTTVKTLRFKGIALGAIHKFIDKQEPLSPLVITEELRLMLPLYNLEIELSAQMKALYFLFLNHPEGIILQHLEDYHSELMNYYRQTNNGVRTPKMEESMKKLEMYGNNQLHVIITRIREAFCSKFDERLACNYFISGKKGEPYRIPLDPQLVEWVE